MFPKILKNINATNFCPKLKLFFYKLKIFCPFYKILNLQKNLKCSFAPYKVKKSEINPF